MRFYMRTSFHKDVPRYCYSVVLLICSLSIISHCNLEIKFYFETEREFENENEVRAYCGTHCPSCAHYPSCAAPSCACALQVDSAWRCCRLDPDVDYFCAGLLLADPSVLSSSCERGGVKRSICPNSLGNSRRISLPDAFRDTCSSVNLNLNFLDNSLRIA